MIFTCPGSNFTGPAQFLVARGDWTTINFKHCYFLISENNFWYQKIMAFSDEIIFWYQKLPRFSDIRNYFLISENNFWYQKIVAFSDIRKWFSDIRNSHIFLCQKLIFWYQKLISDIRKSFSDIRKSVLKSYLAFHRKLYSTRTTATSPRGQWVVLL